MTFNSYSFIFLFLPITVLLYYLFKKYKNWEMAKVILLFFSLCFYIYAGWQHSILLLIGITLNYFFYKLLQQKVNSFKLRQVILFTGITGNLCVLLYYKYFDFFIDNLNLLLKTNFRIRHLTVPLGISFITFQQIAFLVDSYKRETSTCSFTDYSLFTTFFPHISSGPILLHKDFFPLISQKKEQFDWKCLSVGIYMFAMGLGKKVLIADMFAKAVDWGYSNLLELNATSALFISIAYSIQIYFDFSGYSDMAIGISRILQLDLPVNFNSPYKANTITEFWNRWHITLTRFFTRYLYIPLGGNRQGPFKTYINTLIVFLCSGLWHGANWTFILWGAMHGSFMIITKQFQFVINKVPQLINHIITLLFLNFTWILFRAESFTTLKQMIAALLSNNWGCLNPTISSFFQPILLESFSCPLWIYPSIALLFIFFILFKCKNVQEMADDFKPSILSGLWTVIVLVLSILSLSGVSTFVYAYF